MPFALVILGITLRLLLASLGGNYDLESWWIVSELVAQGKSPYAETHRYNYGPIWFGFIATIRLLLRAINLENIAVFHICIAAILTFFDLLIAKILEKRIGVYAAFYFFLNPVLILLTGYHSQFDNIAVAACIAGWLFFTDNAENKGSPKWIFGLLLIGLSLVLKHLFILFPLWIALWWRPANPKQRTLAVLIPYTMFVAAFIPWAFDSQSLKGIADNVLFYSSLHGEGLLTKFVNLLMPMSVWEEATGIHLSKYCYFALLVFFGGVARNEKGLGFPAMYLLGLVGLSTAMAPQYAALVVFACAVYYRNPFGWLFTGVALLGLSTDKANIGLFIGEYIPQALHLSLWVMQVPLICWAIYYASRRTNS